MNIAFILFSLGFISLAVSVVFLLLRLLKLEKNIARVHQLLMIATPAVERRILEQGTAVVLPEPWQDEEIYNVS